MARPIFNGDIWGETVKGNPTHLVRPSSIDIGNGLLEAAYPIREHKNWAIWIAHSACQWMEESGDFDWDLNVTYELRAKVNYSGKTYISIQGTNLNKQPDTQTTYWQPYYDWLIEQAGQTLVVADEASLGTGVVDGQIRGTVAGNLYTWDDTDEKWNGRSGNNYSSDPAFGNVQFENGQAVNINGITKRYNGTTWDEIGSVNIGKLDRPSFEAVASSTNINLVGPAGYHLDGAGWVWWDSTITYSLASLTTDTWTYIYIDESDISQARKITNSDLTDSTTAPTYSSTKGGYYNGNDRCIFAVYGTSGTAYRLFYHNGDMVQWDEKINDRSGSTAPITWTDQALTVPAFCKRVLVTFVNFYDDAAATISWRINGSSSSGHIATRVAVNADSEYNQLPVDVDSAQKIEIIASAVNTTLGINSDGYYLPKGL